MDNIKKDTKKFNSNTWSGLTLGKLLCICQMAKKQSEDNPIANDIYHEVLNYLFDNAPDYYKLLKNS